MGACMSATNSTPLENQKLWQDRFIRWDQSRSSLALRSGEIVAKQYENIEDTKGENGLGSLIISNLRIIWTSNHNRRLNISIGLGNISYIHFNMSDSPTFGRIRAPHIMTQLGHSRFEFMFASRNEIAMDLFSDLDNALRRYKATRVFRDLVFRDGQLMKDGELVVYHGEALLKKFPSCGNITSDEKFPGSLYITNRRIIWNSNRNDNVNVSVPYIQLRSVGTRGSNFGSALVVETTQATGAYVLGFKFENQASLYEAQLLLSHHFHSRKIDPFLGPLDGVVQYVDDRLLVIPEDQTITNKNDTEVQSPAAAPLTLPGGSPPDDDAAAALPDRHSTPRSPFAAALSSAPCFYIPSTAQVECLFSPRNRSFDSSSTESVITDSSSQDTRNVSDGERRASESVPLGEPVNLHQIDPLLLELQAGQASVVYSSANQTEQDRAEYLLSISPSSKKYQAPKCVVCMATTTEAAFVPCGHLCSCMTCASKLKNCPICRSEVEKLLRIYLQAA